MDFLLSVQGASSLQFFFVGVSVVLHVEFVLSLFRPHLSFFWYLVRAMFRDCGISLDITYIFARRFYF